VVAVACRRRELDGMPRSGPRSRLPARYFLGVVARFAEPRPIRGAGGPLVVPWHDVVVVPDRRVAIGSAAEIVPGTDQTAKPRREQAGPGIHGDEVARAGSCVEPSKPNPEVVRARSGTSGSVIFCS
jgi:hypothetical protein